MNKKITFTNVNVYNGVKDMKLLKEVNVEIYDGKINNIGHFEIDKKSKIIDLHGQYMVPGLINLHSHLPSSGKVNKVKLGNLSGLVKFVCSNPIGRKIGLSLCKKAAKTSLNSGVTTVRCVGGVANFDSKLRDKINAKKVKGPRLLVANSAIGVKGGHMDGTVAVAVSSTEDAIKRVHQLKEENVDLIKLMITGGVLDGGILGHPAGLKMSLEMVDAICKEAHKLGLKVAAHVESPEGMEVAIKGGVDSIEHASHFDENLIPLLKENKVSFVSTLSPAVPFISFPVEIHGYGEIAKINTQIVLDGVVAAGKIALKNDISLGLGTDSGSTFVVHYNFYKELVLFEKYYDVSKSFALYSATLGNARIAGIDNITGSIELNKSADLLIVKDDPLNDLHNLGKPSLVVFRGELIKPKVKHNKTIDSLIDSII